jgi:HD-GYP domain-containing protein (c-di-GMP phosphodiesterase class II)
MDLISPVVANHHKQVAYIAFQLGSELGMTMHQKKDLIMAGALHDIGAFSLRERIDSLDFEAANLHKHAETGYCLLYMFEPFAKVAEIVRYHHVPWGNGSGGEFLGQAVPYESHVVHLADRIAVLIDTGKEIFAQVPHIIETIEAQRGKLFEPQLVECFKSLSVKEFFWLDIVSNLTGPYLQTLVHTDVLALESQEILSLSSLFAKLIDFRSPFTANHSSGIAAAAEALAGFLPYSKNQILMMRVAGHLHDLGKLAVPVEILEKQDKLTISEWNIMRRHTYYGYHILEPIQDFKTINLWASLHHERLDGNGYPFHIKGDDLTLGSRVLAVADVFGALTEDRPYRKAMPDREVVQVLEKLAATDGLDPDITNILKRNYDHINGVRLEAQEKAATEYRQFCQLYNCK